VCARVHSCVLCLFAEFACNHVCACLNMSMRAHVQSVCMCVWVRVCARAAFAYTVNHILDTEP